MNELGVCVGINNLMATDGQVGVTWPTVVRDALTHETASEARDVIPGAQLAGAHNYLVFDRDGIGYNIEAMPTVRPVTTLGNSALVHTNHTTFPETDAVQAVRPDALTESSRRRLDTATKYLDRTNIKADDLMELTREPEAVCQVAVEPYHVESSGAAVMCPKTGEFWPVWGLPSMNEYQQVGFGD